MLKILSFAQKVNAIEANYPEAKGALTIIKNNAQQQNSRSVPMSALMRRVKSTKKPQAQVEKALRYYADLQGVEVK